MYLRGEREVGTARARNCLRHAAFVSSGAASHV